MDNNSKKQRVNSVAQNASIFLGDTQIDGYEIPPIGSGEYVCSKNQICEILELNPRRLSQLLRLKLAQILIPQGLKVIAINTAKGRIEGIPVHQVSLIFALASSRGNTKATILLAACTSETLERKFDKKFKNYRTEEEREQRFNDRCRILSIPDPWKKLYEKEACTKAFRWMGADFYWTYCYFWLTEDERCKLNEVNPVIKGDRIRGKIHQFIESDTKTRLEPRIRELCVLLLTSTSKQDFQTRYARMHNSDQQEFF